jgi:predicted neuraminidase
VSKCVALNELDQSLNVILNSFNRSDKSTAVHHIVNIDAVQSTVITELTRESTTWSCHQSTLKEESRSSIEDINSRSIQSCTSSQVFNHDSGKTTVTQLHQSKYGIDQLGIGVG